MKYLINLKKKKFEIKTYKLLCEWYRQKTILYKKELKSKNFSDKFEETIKKALNKCKEYNKEYLFNIIKNYKEKIKNIHNNNI